MRRRPGSTRTGRPTPPAADADRSNAGRRLGVAVGAGLLSAAAAIGLTATAAWLITTAAGKPPVLTLMVAIVGVRAFGLARGVLRYVERLTGHDAVLRRLVDVRARLIRPIARLAPAGLPELRVGDLVSRLVHDVDSIVDRMLRVRLPYLIAAVVGILSMVATRAVNESAAAGLGVTLLIAAIVAPGSRRADRDRRPQRRREEHARGGVDAVPGGVARVDPAR